jgi:hypothetical protein
MNRPEVYHKSVQILYDAYFNDTLDVMVNCYACAVGNLIAGNLGMEIEKVYFRVLLVGYKICNGLGICTVRILRCTACRESGCGVKS